MAKKPTASSFDDDDEPAFTPGALVAPPSVPSSQHRDRRGINILDAHVDCFSKTEFVREIGRLWGDAQDRFIEIGRYLLEAKDRLGHGEFLPLVEQELPFGARVANKLMVVARALDDGIFPRDVQLPPSYSTVYELVSLKPAERDRAFAENVIRPDVTREAIVAFRRRLRGEGGPPPLKSKAAMQKRLEHLVDERCRIDAEILALEQALRG